MWFHVGKELFLRSPWGNVQLCMRKTRVGAVLESLLSILCTFPTLLSYGFFFAPPKFGSMLCKDPVALPKCELGHGSSRTPWEPTCNGSNVGQGWLGLSHHQSLFVIFSKSSPLLIYIKWEQNLVYRKAAEFLLFACDVMWIKRWGIMTRTSWLKEASYGLSQCKLYNGPGVSDLLTTSLNGISWVGMLLLLP